MRWVYPLKNKLGWQQWLLVGFGFALLGCSTGPERPSPSPLPQVAESAIKIQPSWRANLGATVEATRAQVSGGQIALASDEGRLEVRQASDGKQLWQLDIPQGISAGVGFDGRTAVVVDSNNRLTAAVQGEVVWRQTLDAKVFTPPLVVAGRVFVITGARHVFAFDAANGARLWKHTFSGEPLALRAPLFLGAYQNSVMAGLAENLVALRPDNGQAFWSVSMARPRGATEIERLSDIVAGAFASGDAICARAFQLSVACASLAKGQRLWAQEDEGHTGLAGDDTRVFGSNSNGVLKAWQLESGDLLWQQDALKFRQLSAPVSLGQTIAVGDVEGYVHWVSKSNGQVLARVPTDGSPVVGAPLLVNQTLIAVTAKGGVFAWQPE